MLRILTNEDKYNNEMPFSYSLESFVKKSSEYRWWFRECVTTGEGLYTVVFSSYETPEYKNFVLSVSVSKIGDAYNFEIVKEVTALAE